MIITWCELGDEELSVRKPTEKEPLNNGFRDIGWFTDARGYKHFGIIPITEMELAQHTRTSPEDYWLNDALN